jgi:hypothetical protein
MSKKFALTFGLAVLIACAAGIKGLKEPTSENSLLVIGSVVFENNYFDDRAEVYQKGIEVAILARYEEDGKTKTKGYWTTSDENGYFFLSNVPKGQYALKGIRLAMGRGTLLTISNPLRYSGSVYVIQRGEHVIFDGDYFAYEPRGRIVNLEHNYFAIDQTSNRTFHVEHLAQAEVEDQKLVTGKILNLPPVEQYFIEKYPQSSWVPLLEKSMARK